MLSLKETKDGLVIAVKITPKANCNEIIGWENEELKIRIAAAPEKGAANEELINFFAKLLKIRKAQITITHGLTSRHKRICFSGITITEAIKRINFFLECSQ